MQGEWNTDTVEDLLPRKFGTKIVFLYFQGNGIKMFSTPLCGSHSIPPVGTGQVTCFQYNDAIKDNDDTDKEREDEDEYDDDDGKKANGTWKKISRIKYSCFK